MVFTDTYPDDVPAEQAPKTEIIHSSLELVGAIPNAAEVVGEPLLQYVAHEFDVTLTDEPDSPPTYSNDSTHFEYSPEDLEDIHRILLPGVMLVDRDVQARHPETARRYNVLVNGGRTGSDPWEGRIASNRLPHIDNLQGEIYIAAFGGSTLVWNNDFEIPSNRTTQDDRFKAKQTIIDAIREHHLKPQSAGDGEFIRLDNTTVHASCEDEIIGEHRLVIFITPEGAGVSRASNSESN